jgi:hypothetical protein
VVPAIQPFDNPFIGKGMGRMAVIARGYSFMAGIIPTIKLLLHDMAVHTSIGVIGQIRGAFSIAKGIGS